MTGKTPTSRAGTSNDGYTLIELALVILVIGLILTFALPKLNIAGSSEIKSAARHLSGTLQSVFDQAVYQKKSYWVQYDFSKQAYQVLLSQETEGLSDVAHSNWVSLPDRVRFKDISIDLSDERVTEGKVTTRFSPEGWADGTVIHLTDGKQDYTLELMPFSGKVKILEGYVEIVENNES